ncbi:MAG: ATP-binding protein [bacterium]|nr:ATP-binding protein [bacterium]
MSKQNALKEQYLAALAERIESSDPQTRFEAAQVAFQLFSQLTEELAPEGAVAYQFGERFAQADLPFFSSPDDETKQSREAAFAARLALICGLPGLQSASPWTTHLLASVAEEVQLEPGEDFLSPYRPVTGLYLVPGEVLSPGLGLRLPLAESGGIFGEQSCRFETVQAAMPLQVAQSTGALLVPKDRLLALLPWNPELRGLLIETVLDKNSQKIKKLSQEFLACNAELRLSQQILDNIGQASLSIDEKGEIGSHYSSVAAQYLGHQELAGRPFADLILQGDRKALRSYYRALAMIFGGNQFDPKVVLELLPKRANLHGRQFRLHYYFTDDHLGFVTSVFVRLEDITKELALQARQQAEAEREELDRKVQEKIRANLGAFLSLLDLIEYNQAHLEDLNKNLLAQTQPDPQDLRGMMKELHSIKGLCGQFGLGDLKTQVHQAEEQIQRCARGEGVAADMLEAIKITKKGYRRAKGLIDSLGPEVVRILRGVNFERGEYDLLVAAVHAKDWEQVGELVLSRDLVPAAKVVEHWERDLKELAKDLGKQVSFTFNAPADLSLHQDLARILNFELRHCYRNAIDHGIELPEQRQAAGKDPVGQITASLEVKAGRLTLSLQDDGAGIDWERIKNKALEKDHLDHAVVQGLIDQGEPWRILLLPGFSSQDMVSQVSGRGVGLDAVESAVGELGGTLTIQSELGQGTCFLVDLPLS